MNPVCKIMFMWGCLLVIYDFFFRRQYKKSFCWQLLFLFLIFFVVSILINAQGNFYMGIKHLLYSAIVFFLMSSFLYDDTSENIKKYLFELNTIIIWISLIASIVSLIMFAFSISIETDYFGNTIRQGFIDHRLFGVYTSANTGASLSILSFIFMCINSYIKHEKVFAWNKIYCLNAVVQIFYFALTLSRGGQLTACVALMIGMIIFLLPKFAEKGSLYSALIKIIVIYAGISFIGFAGFTVIQENAVYIPNLVGKIEQKDLLDDIAENEISEEKNEVKRIESGDDLSNGRYTIWSGGISLWEKSKIFGTVDARIDKEKMKSGKYDISNLGQSELWWLDRADGNLHNVYIQVLVNSGIVGAVVFLLYAFCMCRRYLIFFLDKRILKNQSYYVIGLSFVIVGAFSINGFFENRLLFDRQDPIGLLFWLYIGAGSALIESMYREEKYTGKSLVFACDTPLQVLNAINLKENQYEDVEGDIYIYNQFSDAKRIGENLKTCGIFNDVYIIGKYKKYPSILQKIITLVRMIFPFATLRRYAESDQMLYKKNYDYMVFCFMTPFTMNVFGMARASKVILLEDGLGTYLNDIIGQYISKTFKNIAENTRYKKLLTPQIAAVYNPSIYEASGKKVIELKSKFSNEILNEIVRVYHYRENDLYKRHQIIYLTQPLKERDGYDSENEKNVEMVLQKYKDELVIRYHPRDVENRINKYNQDDFGNLWELECLSQISSNNILIGAFSTAQFMPKILKNEEPYLIFLFKIFFDSGKDEYWREVEEFIKNFQKFYTQKDRICIPNTVGELGKVLEKITEN